MIRAVKAARALHPLAAKPRLSIRQRCKRTMVRSAQDGRDTAELCTYLPGFCTLATWCIDRACRSCRSTRCCGASVSHRHLRAFLQAAAPRAAPNFQLLQYEYVPDILEKRGPHREGHLAAAEGLRAQGKCLLGGAFGDPVEGGLFVLKGMSKEVRVFRTAILPYSRCKRQRARHVAVLVCVDRADASLSAMQHRPHASVCICAIHSATNAHVQEIESFVSDDPYVKAGLVTKWCEPPPPMHVDHACRHRVASLRGFGSYTTMNILCLHDCP